jgi:hypothetical protein
MKVDPDLKSLMKAVRKVSKPLAETVHARVGGDADREHRDDERGHAAAEADPPKAA